MLTRLCLLAALFATSSLLTSCETYRTRRVVFNNHPVAVYVTSKVIDEENLEYAVKFRNIGREVLSFDYTIADEAGVPHVDSQGPNSGLIENLYPGAEIEVPNPTERMTIHATLGTVTYGKKSKEELVTIYKPGQAMMPAGDAGLLPPATPGA